MGASFSKAVRNRWVDLWARVGLDARGEFGIVGAGSILRCASLSFLVYFVPLALLRRRLRDPAHFRSAVAFGLFAGLYRSVRVLVARLVPQEHRQAHQAAPFVAGALGGLAAVLVDSSFLSSLFVVWWCVRALRSSPWVQRVEAHPAGPVAVMCFASGLLSPAGLVAPREHHPSYFRFLVRFFECSGARFSDFHSPPAGLTIGQTVAPDGRLFAWYARYVRSVVWESAKIYVPLHLVWAALRLPARTSLRVVLSNTARSIAFLSTYTCSMMAMLLADSHFFSASPPRWHLHLWTPLAGLAVLVERSNRQAELAFFCLAHAINSVYNHARLRGLVRPNNLIGTLLLMVASGRIMQVTAMTPGRGAHLLFGEKMGRLTQKHSQSNPDKPMDEKSE